MTNLFIKLLLLSSLSHFIILWDADKASTIISDLKEYLVKFHWWHIYIVAWNVAYSFTWHDRISMSLILIACYWCILICLATFGILHAILGFWLLISLLLLAAKLVTCYLTKFLFLFTCNLWWIWGEDDVLPPLQFSVLCIPDCSNIFGSKPLDFYLPVARYLTSDFLWLKYSHTEPHIHAYFDFNLFSIE